jgi:hypothetical protein
MKSMMFMTIPAANPPAMILLPFIAMLRSTF